MVFFSPAGVLFKYSLYTQMSGFSNVNVTVRLFFPFLFACLNHSSLNSFHCKQTNNLEIRKIYKKKKKKKMSTFSEQ